MIINNKRALAYVEKIDKIVNIPQADNIQLAFVNAWSLIIRKNEFKEGDKCVYIEIDSKVPADNPAFEFLASKKFKVKPYKLGKFKVNDVPVVSMGLALPLEKLGIEQDIALDTDLTERLGITYYVVEDNARKADSPNNTRFAAYKKQHAKFYNNKLIKWLMRFAWFRNWQIKKHGGPKQRPWPSHLVSKTDEERCLLGDTYVLTDQGRLRIADIVNKQRKVKALSYNEMTGALEYQPIVGYQRIVKKAKPETLLAVKFPYHILSKRLNTIYCTPDHKFATPDGYVEAGRLVAGTKIYTNGTCYEPAAMQAIYGMLLGDSAIAFDRRVSAKTIRIATTHGECQADYLKAKAMMFVDEESYKTNIGKSGFSKNKTYKWTLNTDYEISKKVLEDCVVDGRKYVTANWAEKLTPLSLAIWYLDDGNLKHRESDTNKRIIFATCNFNFFENQCLINRLADFGIIANLKYEKHNGKDYPIITLVNSEVEKFMELIKLYVPASMKYKVTPKYEDLPCMLPKFKQFASIYETQVTNVEVAKRKASIVYDITVQNNHNFFANRILTHNCQNMPWILEDKGQWVVTEKIDGTSTTVVVERIKRFLRKDTFKEYICSRNVCFSRNPKAKVFNGADNIYTANEARYNMVEHLTEYLVEHPNLKFACIQGESYGEGWQGNPLKMKGTDFAGFNFKTDEGRFGSVDGKKLLASWGIPWVPIIYEDFVLPDTVDELIELATGPSALNPEVLREGWVIRKPDGTTSFKAVSTTYLLNKKE